MNDEGLSFEQRVQALNDAQREQLAQQLRRAGAFTGAMQRRLVAYVVSDSGADENTLRDFMQERLPEPMRPGAYVLVDALPRTATGKIDRRALPAVAPRTESDADQLILPRTATEKAIAAAWSDVLGVDPVGLQDDFFSVGGDSLLATRVVSRIRQALSVDINPRALFEAPRLSDLAAVVDQMKSGTDGEREEFEL